MIWVIFGIIGFTAMFISWLIIIRPETIQRIIDIGEQIKEERRRKHQEKMMRKTFEAMRAMVERHERNGEK